MALLSWIVIVTRLGSARVTFALSTYGSLLKMRLAAAKRLMKNRLSPVPMPEASTTSSAV